LVKRPFLKKDLVEAVLPPSEEDGIAEIVLEVSMFCVFSVSISCLFSKVRAGTGGSEAQLFALEVFEMYRLHCTASKGWNFRTVNKTEGDVGGIREASAIVSGAGVFSYLRLEGGVHRVQVKRRSGHCCSSKVFKNRGSP
jgi:hypothetical protein